MHPCPEVSMNVQSLNELISLKTISLQNIPFIEGFPIINGRMKLPKVEKLWLEHTTFSGDKHNEFEISQNLQTFVMMGISVEVFPIISCLNDSGGCALRHLALDGAGIHSFMQGPLIQFSNNVITLSLRFNDISSLHKDLFYNLWSLQFLDISHNKLSELSSTVFVITPLLEVLYLNNNNLRSVPTNIIKHLNSIKLLDMKFNEISHITIDDFQNCQSLLWLDLSGNRIQSIARQSFANCTNLDELDLSHNMITSLAEVDAAFGWNRLRHLFLSHNAVTSIQHSLQVLYDLEHIFMNDNAITTSGTMHSINIVMIQEYFLNLADNTGITQITIPMQILRGLNLSNTSINYISADAYEIDLRSNNLSNISGLFANEMFVWWLTVDNNAFEVVEESNLPYMPTLNTISFKYNFITYIHSSCMKNIPSIMSFDVSNNFLKYIDMELFEYVTWTIFDSNPIRNFQRWNVTHHRSFVKQTENFKEMSMKNCNLYDVPAQIPLPHKGRLHFDDNYIEEFGDFIPPESNDVSARFYSNPLQCSCRLRWLKHMPNYKDHYRFDLCLDVVRGEFRMFDEIPLNHFLCIKNRADVCDPLCTCMGPSEAQDVLPTYVRCINQGLTEVPELISQTARIIDLQNNSIHSLVFPTLGSVRLTRTIFLQHSNIKHIMQTAFSELSNLHQLHLDYNEITTLDMKIFQPLTHLRKLFLAHNLINHIDLQADVMDRLEHLMKFTLNDNELTNISITTRNYIESLPKLRHLTLSGNPWLCECDRQRAEFKSWLVFGMTRRIADIDSMSCFSVKRNIECIDYFNDQLQYLKKFARDTWISGGVLATLALILLLLYIFDSHMKAFLVYVCPRLRGFRNDLTSHYDVFIVYDHHDENVRHWVTSTLVPKLEENQTGWGYRAFLMERDSRPGSDHSETIHAAVQMSKSMIFIVSPGYARSPWLYQALREGLYSIYERHHYRVMIILYNIDASSAGAMDELLSEYITTNNYLIPSHWQFWFRLFFQLPNRVSSNSTSTDHPAGREIEMDDLEQYTIQYQ